MRGVVKRIALASREPMQSLGPLEARRAYAEGAEVLDLPRAPLARVEDITLPVAPGRTCAARVYANHVGALPVLLYLHGGGFTIGGIETHDSLCRQLALRSDVAVVSLDYRLAPEHRFPAAVDDAWGALQCLATQASRWGLDGSRLAVGGDSAGGTLAAVSALMARDAGMKLGLQVLITPGTTAFADTASHARFGEGYLLDHALIEWFFSHYLSHEERADWRFAPLHADRFDGLAPAWLGLAECDPLVDEGIAYGDALRRAGVPVQLELWKGVTHNFIKFGRSVSEARQAHASIGDALRAALLQEPTHG
jgi:acetyl esterase